MESISEINPITGEVMDQLEKTVIFPGSHYVSEKDNLMRAISDIREELRERLDWFYSNNKLVEAQRLEQRTQLDLEMLEELGYCNGIENYSRHLDGRKPGTPPACLLDYFPEDFFYYLLTSLTLLSLKSGVCITGIVEKTKFGGFWIQTSLCIR